MKRPDQRSPARWRFTFAALTAAIWLWSGCYIPAPVDTSKMTPTQRAQAEEAWRLALKSRRLTVKSKYAEAIKAGERALVLTQGVVEETEPAVIAGMIDLANLYFFADDYDKALALMLRAKAIMDQHGKGTGFTEVTLPDGKSTLARYDGKGRGDYAYCLRSLSAIYWALSRYEEALPLAREAVEVAQKPFHQQSFIGFAAKLTNQVPGTLGYVDLRSLSLTYGSTLANLGGIEAYLGRYGAAETTLRRAKEAYEVGGATNHQFYAMCLEGLAFFNHVLGQNKEGLRLAQQALPVFERCVGTGDPNYASCLNTMGVCCLGLDRDQEALALFRKALARFDKKPGRRYTGTAACLHNLAFASARLGRDDEAVAYGQEAMEVYEAALGTASPGYALAAQMLAEIKSKQGHAVEALSVGRQALASATAAGVPEILAGTQATMSELLAKAGQPEAAIFFGKQSVNSRQGLRANLAGMRKPAQRSYVARSEPIYHLLADLLIEAGRLSEAQQVLTMLKEEEYFEFIRRDATTEDVLSARIALNAGEAGWRKRTDEVSGRIVSLAAGKAAFEGRLRYLTVAEKQQLEDLTRQLAEANRAFMAVLEEIYASKPLADLRDLNLRSAEAMQSTLEELGAGVVMLHYVAVENRLHMILTTPRVQVARSTNVPRSELNRRVMELRAALKDPRSDPLPAARALYQWVFEPVAEDLRQAQARTLLVSLEGALRYIPLAALHDGQHYLLENYCVALLTEAGKDKLKDQPAKEWRVAGLGVSRSDGQHSALPNVPLELAGIVKTPDDGGLLPGDIWLDDQFTKEVFRQALADRTPVLHVASHFVFRPGTIYDSYLLLGGGQRLELAAIRDEKWPFFGVDLLALSACETAVSEAQPGGGGEVEGFAMLAQQRGAKGILATLWSVADPSTCELMRDFYRWHQADQRANKAEALRRAQLALLRGQGAAAADRAPSEVRGAKQAEPATDRKRDSNDPAKPYAHPYYWAPFVLFGNWL